MKTFKQWLKKHWLVITLIILIFALFFTIRFFIHSFETSSSEGDLHTVYYYHHHDTDNGQQPVMPPLLSINGIQPWMTFDYVNFVFKLPADYLKNIFGINDPRYPNIRIDGYARESNIDQTLLLSTIKKYITTYKGQ